MRKVMLVFLVSSLTELWGTSEVKGAKLVVLRAFCSNICLGNITFMYCKDIFMSLEYPVTCSKSNLLLLHYFSGNATFEFVMVFTGWCLVLCNPSKSCSFLIPVKLYFMPKQSDLSLGVKVYKPVYNHSLAHIFCSKDPLLYAWRPTAPWILLELLSYLSMLLESFPWCRRLALRSMGSVTIQRAARFEAEKSPGPEEVWDLLFAIHDRGYLSILLFRASGGEDYSPFPGSFLESMMQKFFPISILRPYCCSLLPWLVCICKDMEDRLFPSPWHVLYLDVLHVILLYFPSRSFLLG